jgi:AcrR family transcriptional regulator
MSIPKQKKDQILELRGSGASINEIVAATGIAKTTVWHHVKNLTLEPKIFQQLRSKRGGGKARLANHWKTARGRADMLLKGNDREEAIALAMLYWAEGTKKSFDFTNTDGRMIGFYISNIQRILGVPPQDIRITVRYFDKMNEFECLDFWHRATGLPLTQFKVRYNDGGKRGKSRYGICRVTGLRGQQYLKVITSLADEFMNETGNKPS